MPRSNSTMNPDGAFARALDTLDGLCLVEEASEVRRLLIEWLRYREEAASSRDELAAARKLAGSATERERKSRDVARAVLKNWRNLALVTLDRDQLAQVDQMVRAHPWLRDRSAD